MNVRALPAPLTALRLPRLPYRLLAWPVLAWFAIILGQVAPPGDAISFYNAHGEHLYLGRSGFEAYAYSPAFAQAITPLQALPFDVFRSLVAGAELWGLAYLLGPWWALGVVVFEVWPIFQTFDGGNLQIFATAMLVVALRYPAAWPVSLLMKVTPGIGIAWHAFRGEWRAVGIGLGLTAAIVAVSFAIEPRHWFEWVTWMAGAVDDSPDRPFLSLWIRGPIALGVIWWAARTERIWLVPIAAAIASPEGHGHWLLALGALRLWLAGAGRDGGRRPATGQRVPGPARHPAPASPRWRCSRSRSATPWRWSGGATLGRPSPP